MMDAPMKVSWGWGVMATLMLAPDAARAGGGDAFVQEARIAASVTGPFFLFGWAVDVSGDTALVGASGVAAFVFRRTGGTWTEEQWLTVAAPSSTTAFASAVAIDGDTLVVGAYGDDTFCSDPNCNSGAVHVFTRSGSVWSFQQTLFAPDAAPGDLFGYAVALEGGTLLVGARDGDAGPGAANSGTAYVFIRSGSAWSLQQRLVASDAAFGDFFGIAVALDGERALVGASQTSDAFFRQGSAYVFVRSGSTWMQEQELTSATPGQAAAFGESVSLAGSTAAIGAPGESAAYAFVRGASWTQEARLVAPDAAPGDAFAGSLSLSADTLVVGASGDDDTGSLSGSAYVFERTGASWGAPQKLAALDATPEDQFGWAVALDGDTLVASAVNDDDGGPASGTTYAFRRVPAPFTGFCDGADGALAACPCSNPGLADTGCENAGGTGGVRLQTIAIDVPNGFATLLASGYPVAANPTAVVMRSDARAATPAVLFDGVLCLGAAGLLRVQANVARDGVSRHVLLHADGAGTFHYQVLYRSLPLAYCDPTAGANTSSGVSITW